MKQQYTVDTPKEKLIKKQIQELEEKLTQCRDRRTIMCPSCEKRTPVNQATIVRRYHYVRPYSCTGGDYWTFSNEYLFYCSKCDSFHRAYVGSYDRKWDTDEIKSESLKLDRVKMFLFIEEYQHHFSEMLEDYGDGGTIDEIREHNKKRQDRFDYSELY